MKSKLLLAIVLITLFLPAPAHAGLLKYLRVPLKKATDLVSILKKSAKSGVSKAGKFGVEVGAGVTAAVVYANITKSSVQFDGQYVSLTETLYAYGSSGNQIEIPRGKYRVSSQEGNTVSIEAPGLSVGSIELTLN